MIFLVVLTVVYPHEKADWIDRVGVSVIVVGLALLGLSMVKATQPFSYRPMVSWFFIVFLLSVVAFSFFLAFRKKRDSSVFAGLGLGVLIGLNAVLIKLAIHDVSTLYSQYHLAGSATPPSWSWPFSVRFQRRSPSGWLCRGERPC